MRYSKPVLTVIVVLIILSFAFSTVGAQAELPPTEDAQSQDAPIEVDALVVPVSPINGAIVFTRKPVFTFRRNYDANGYMMQVREYGSVTNLYTYSAAFTCTNYVCWMQPGTKLNMAGELYTGDYEWRVAYKVGTTWHVYSSWARFFVADNGFNSTFDLNYKDWNIWHGPWTWNPTKGQMWTLGYAFDYNGMYFSYYYPSFDYTVRMKRKVNEFSTNGVWVWGKPSPATTDFFWYNGYHIIYRNDKTFQVTSYKTGDPQLLVGIDDCAAVNPFGWNEIRVVGIYPYLDFWLNGVYLGYITLTEFPVSYYLGFDMYSTGAVDEKFLVDWAKASVPSLSVDMVHDPAMELHMEPVAEGAEPPQ